MSGNLQNKSDLQTKLRALVLGGRGDIGSEIANKLSSEGIEVVSVGRSDFDLGSAEEIDNYFSKKGNSFDILVHSGGLNDPQLFEKLSNDQIRKSLDVNLHGFLQIMKICLPYWRQRGFGRVVVLSSLYGFLARKARLPYVMSKHALNGAVKTLAIELAPYGILINSISPGYIDTKMTRKNNSPQMIEKLVSKIPLAKLGTPEDIAEVAIFLCSAKNKYLTGQDIIVDGGFSVGGFQE